MDERFFQLEDFEGIKTLIGDTVYYYKFTLTDSFKIMIVDVGFDTQDWGLSAWFSDRPFYIPHTFSDFVSKRHVQKNYPLIIDASTDLPTGPYTVNLPAGEYYLNIMNNTGGDKWFTIKEK